jgi:hypothetical protein
VFHRATAEGLLATGGDVRREALLLATFRYTDGIDDHVEVLEPQLADRDWPLLHSDNALDALSTSPFAAWDWPTTPRFKAYLEIVNILQTQGVYAAIRYGLVRATSVTDLKPSTGAEALIFDWDGTLADTTTANYRSLCDGLGEYGDLLKRIGSTNEPDSPPRRWSAYSPPITAGHSTPRKLLGGATLRFSNASCMLSIPSSRCSILLGQPSPKSDGLPSRPVAPA